MRLLPVRSGHIEALAYAPDGRWLAAVANPWGRLWLWDLRAAEVGLLRAKERDRGGGAEQPGCLAYSPAGDLLGFGVDDQLALRDSRTGHARYFLNPSNHHSGCLAFTPDGKTLVSAGSNRADAEQTCAVMLWDVASGRQRKLPVPLPAGTAALAVSRDAAVVLWREPPSRGVPARLTLWHVPGLRRLARLSLGASPACAAFSPARRHLAVAVEDVVLLYDIGPILDAFSSPPGSAPWTTLALPVWWKHFLARVPPVASPQVLEGHRDRVLALAFSPDGEALFSGGRDRAVRCWDVATRRERAAWNWPIGVVYALAVAPDGLTAAAGGNAGRSVLWDLTWF
jgi:WD40 repeat protein